MLGTCPRCFSHWKRLGISLQRGRKNWHSVGTLVATHYHTRIRIWFSHNTCNENEAWRTFRFVTDLFENLQASSVGWPWSDSPIEKPSKGTHCSNLSHWLPIHSQLTMEGIWKGLNKLLSNRNGCQDLCRFQELWKSYANLDPKRINIWLAIETPMDLFWDPFSMIRRPAFNETSFRSVGQAAGQSVGREFYNRVVSRL